MDMSAAGFDGSALARLPVASAAQLGQAAVGQAVALLTAAGQWPETLDALVDEIAVHGSEPLRVAIGAALLMLSYEAPVSFDPPAVRLPEASDVAVLELASRFGPVAAAPILQPAQVAAAAYCNQADEVYVEVLRRYLGEEAPASRRYEMLLALAVLTSAWVGPAGERRDALLFQVGLAAAG
jgi:hypothetical protein